MRSFRQLLLFTGIVAMESCAPVAAPAPAVDIAVERAAVDSVLTTLHQTASEAAWDQYFALYSSDAVFLGTDATERWNLDQFRNYAGASQGWTYSMTERNIFIAPDGNTAWFDERLNNDSYGETRGTGVLVKGDSGWKIEQYNLAFVIPNDLALKFVAEIRAQ